MCHFYWPINVSKSINIVETCQHCPGKGPGILLVFCNMECVATCQWEKNSVTETGFGFCPSRGVHVNV